VELKDLLHGDLKQLIETVGYIGVWLIVFAESGMMVGFFFPGDSLLFTAGLLASQGLFDVWVLAIGTFIAAVVGDSIGYYIGHKFGRRLFSKENSFLFNVKHLQRAERFYEKHGGKTIILARFIPVIRAFAPVAAGIGSMRYITFISYNIFGGALWAFGMIFLGYYLGRTISDVDKYLLPIIALIIFISILPPIIETLKDKEHRKKLLAMLKISK
jgi:membrane-associated protein